MESPALPVVLFILFYFALYRHDPLAPLHRTKRGDWNQVFRALGLPFRTRTERSLFFLIALAGVAVVVLGLFQPLEVYAVLELAGTFAVMFIIARCVPIPNPPRTVALTYPRLGRADFAEPTKDETKRKINDTKEVDVSGLKLFYVSNLSGHFFSLPAPDDKDVRLADQLAVFLQQNRPRFAWIQIIYARAGVHRLLEEVKRGLIYDKQTLNYSGKNTTWASQIDLLVRKVNEGLSSDVFAVAVRGVLIGADPYRLSLPFGDEVDSLVPFETRNPNLLYEMAKRRMPELKVPNYFGSRHETSFFLVRALGPYVLPPTKAVESAPAGLEPIAMNEEEAGEVYEAVPVPAIDEPFHFPADGIVELVYDGSLHVLFGGSYGRALLSMGVSPQRYDPLESLKNTLQNNPSL